MAAERSRVTSLGQEVEQLRGDVDRRDAEAATLRQQLEAAEQTSAQQMASLADLFAERDALGDKVAR